jgi:hypothetical protein
MHNPQAHRGVRGAVAVQFGESMSANRGRRPDFTTFGPCDRRNEAGGARRISTTQERTSMRKDDFERWPEEIDVDRVKASPRSIAGGWAVVAIFTLLMLIGPPTVSAVDDAVTDAKQDVVKVEHRLAQSLPGSLIYCRHPG